MIFTPLEKICLHATNIMFWLCLCAFVWDNYEQAQDAVSMFFGSIVVSTIYLILQEVKWI